VGNSSRASNWAWVRYRVRAKRAGDNSSAIYNKARASNWTKYNKARTSNTARANNRARAVTE